MEIQIVGKQVLESKKSGELKIYYIIHYLSPDKDNKLLQGFKCAYEFVSKEVFDSVTSLPFRCSVGFDRGYNGKAVISSLQSLNVNDNGNFN